MSTSARWVSGVIVGVLALAVVTLAYFALDRTRGSDTSEGPRPTLSITPPASTSASPTPSTSTAPSAAATDAPADSSTAAPGASERFLALGSSAAWRATAGQCGVSAPVLERSTDGGRTWRDVTPTYLGIGQILALEAFAGSEAELVALTGSDCELEGLRTFTQGEFWEPHEPFLAATTFIAANDGSVVRTPDGPVAAPCASAWGARADGANTALICDGIAYRLGDDGAWQPLLEGAMAVEASSDGVLAVGGGIAGCDGLAIDGAVCVNGASPAGPAAVASARGQTIIWSADTWVTSPTP
jgi:hypothetical protein